MKITGKQAHILLDLLQSPEGVPMVYSSGVAASVADLEKKGLVERHWAGRNKGAVLTKQGRALIQSIVASEV